MPVFVDTTGSAFGPRPTVLFGRDREVSLAVEVLGQRDVRLLTLTGPGGVGKTRLATALVDRVEDAYDDGARFVDLARLSDTSLLPATVAAALDLDLSSDDAEGALAAYLSDRNLLLVLDNCEHLSTTAAVVAALVTRCPKLTVLATSRAPLGLSWEHRLAVQPLPTPRIGESYEPEDLLQVPAVALFVARAKVADASFGITTQTAHDIAQLVVRLDGLPLAIELAAARSALLSPAQMISRLNAHLALPGIEAKDVPARHRTLRAAIQWSYDQLPADEQALFRTVSVFAGSWSLDAVEAVAAPTVPDIDPLTVVASLVDLNLVQADRSSEVPRFALLQTVREFGLDQLAATADLAVVQQQHAAYFSRLANVDIDRLPFAAQELWANRLDAEHDDLRAALQWLLDRDRVAAGRMAVALAPFWWMKGYVAEGRRWLERALEVTPPDDARIRARLLWLSGELCLWQGQAARGSRLHRDQLEIEERIGEPRGIGLALANLGAAAVLLGDYATAEERLGEAQVYATKAADPRLLAVVLRNQSWLAHLAGDQDAAAELHEQTVELFRGLGDVRDLAIMLISYAEVERDRGRLAHAVALVRQALRLGGDLGDRRTIGFAAQAACTIVGGRAQPELLAHLLSASETYYRTAGMPWDRVHAREHDELICTVRDRLGPVFEELWAAGRDLAVDEVLQLAQSALDQLEAPESPAGGRAQDDNPLSERERQVLTLVAEGLPSKRIARSLGIAERTVKAHLTTSFNKLGAYSRGHAALVARERGLIDVPD